MEHEFYMRQALNLAETAAARGEVPVGCVVVDAEGQIIGRGQNRREELSLATAHAEIAAIEEACRHLGSWRLSDCTLYVTLEPCPMCAGAIINARVGRVVYGTKDALTGSCGSVINLFMERYGHEPQIFGGILAEECASVLGTFFKMLRKTENNCKKSDI